MKDLLDSVDLNTYGLRRTAPNEPIIPDAAETTVETLKPVIKLVGVKFIRISCVNQISV